jgi:hypothetical protein
MFFVSYPTDNLCCSEDERILAGTDTDSMFIRVPDLSDSACLFNGTEPGDIQQGGLGDCWLLSSIAALAEFPEDIRSLFPGQDNLSETGHYTVRLFDSTKSAWVDVGE